MKIYPTELQVYREFYLPVQAQLIEKEEGLNLDISFGKRLVRNWFPFGETDAWMYDFYGTDLILLKRPKEENWAFVMVNAKEPLNAKDDYKKVYLDFEGEYLVSREPNVSFELENEKHSINPLDISMMLKMYEGAARVGVYSLKGSLKNPKTL